MTPAGGIVFLLDVDNTLLDNDRIIADLNDQLAREIGDDGRNRYWNILEALRDALGYVDYLDVIQRCRVDVSNDPRLLTMSSVLLDYPYMKSGFIPARLK